MTFWAHSDPSGLPVGDPDARWQPLSEHLANVSSIARSLAQCAAPLDRAFQDLAAECGILHDFGKYSDCFQQMIQGGGGRCPHSAHGAALAMVGPSRSENKPQHSHVALAIAGHHGGIPDISGGGSSLVERVKNCTEDAVGLVPRAMGDCAGLNTLLSRPMAPPDKGIASRFDLYTRMLFSCLVDADRLDTAGCGVRCAPLNAAARLAALKAHISEITTDRMARVVAGSRAEILRDCFAAAAYPERLLSLSAPTGGGKTLATMAFALQRAELEPQAYRRIIVVIPYLSIIEQNADIYARIFGDNAILEHHSGSFQRLAVSLSDGERFVLAAEDPREDYLPVLQRTEAENWDAPCIVTTSVRFFESLFSNRPADLRRIHNVARSIVILDEVQTLPRRLLSPLLAMIHELSRDWGCTFLFSTATLPAFEKGKQQADDPRWQPGTIREIIRRPVEIRRALTRVRISWSLGGKVGWPELAQQMLAERQALAVVNIRDHASNLYDALIARAEELGCDSDGVIHLSTRMCAAHRLSVIERIRQRLRDKLPCWVASTQLVEAGVDLDFPAVFRAMAPLDSIMQAAGRADREGVRTAVLGQPAGRVVVFIPEDDRMPPNEYREAAGVAESIARTALLRGGSVQPDSADAMREYFERYYGVHPDTLGAPLEELRQRSRFAKLSDQFEMIESRTRDIFIPYDGRARNAIAELRAIGRLTKDLSRRLQHYVVGLYPGEFRKAGSVIEQIRPPSELWVAAAAAYSTSQGLKFELRPEDLYV